MLYKNPRGVSCASCHNDLGDGAYIASFINKKGIKKEFYGPDIRALGFNQFKNAILKGGKIMPRYYLTDKEIEAIFKYIKIVNNYEKPKEAQDTKLDDDNLTEITVEDNYTLEDENDTQNNNTILGKIFKYKEEN